MKKSYIGQKIGKFIVLDRKVELYKSKNGKSKGKIQSNTWVLCKCTKCGKEKWYLLSNAKKAKCCENLLPMGRKKLEVEKNTVINNIRFIERTDRQNSSKEYLWKCKCYCGNIFYTSITRARNGIIKSCGCSRKSNERIELSRKAIQKAQEAIRPTYVEGTSLSNLTNKLSKRNTSGYKGVYYDKRNNRWKAQIKFQQKVHALGTFYTIEEAIKARQRAEEKYFEPVLEKYKEIIKKIEKDFNLSFFINSAEDF